MYEGWLKSMRESGVELRIACDDVRRELEEHGDFYEGFVASVRSAINELPAGEALTSDETARFVVDRIAGEV